MVPGSPAGPRLVCGPARSRCRPAPHASPSRPAPRERRARCARWRLTCSSATSTLTIVTYAPQSTSPRYRLPACIVTLLVVALAATHVVAQGTSRALTTDAELIKEPGLKQLLGDRAGPTGAPGSGARYGCRGRPSTRWMAGNTLRDDKRDGFDVSVNVWVPERRCTPSHHWWQHRHGTLRCALIRSGRDPRDVGARQANRMDSAHRDHARRNDTGCHGDARAATPQAPPAQGPPSPTVPLRLSVAGGAIASQSGGAPFATLETPLRADVIERRGGWAHVRIDGWVRETSLSDAAPSTGLTAADLRAAPDRYVGQTVEWTLQVIAVQKADELRPELPAGQPYILAGDRCRNRDSYISRSGATRSPASAGSSRSRRCACVQRFGGGSRFLPTPVLTFVRRLE